MKKKINKLIYWMPRILGIVFVIFLMAFSLDVFNIGLPLWQTFIGLFMHNIPAFILLIILIISWKHPIVGGIVFSLVGIVLFRSIILSGPSFLIGILFFADWFRNRKYKKI